MGCRLLTPNSLCPLSSTSPDAHAAEATVSHLLSLAPLFPTPWGALPLPSPAAHGSLSCLLLTHRPDRAALPVGALQLCASVVCTLRGLLQTQELFLLPPNPSSSRLQITATPVLKRPALNSDSAIASLSGVNFNPLLPFLHAPLRHTHTFTHPAPPDLPSGPGLPPCLRFHPRGYPGQPRWETGLRKSLAGGGPRGRLVEWRKRWPNTGVLVFSWSLARTLTGIWGKTTLMVPPFLIWKMKGWSGWLERHPDVPRLQV